MRAVVWLRDDLRLHDNAALSAAAQHGEVVPVYILDDAAAGEWAVGAASRWWLHHSLSALQRDFAARGVRLLCMRGDSETLLVQLVNDVAADVVYWQWRYTPFGREQDVAVARALNERGVVTRTVGGALLFEPEVVQTQHGGSFRVFTPFWRRCLALTPRPPLPPPTLLATTHNVRADEVSKWRLLPQPDWAGGLREHWQPGEAAARRRLDDCLLQVLPRYADERDVPSAQSTSRLSPHLRFGEISPQTVWMAVDAARSESAVVERHADKLLSELGWREFAYHLLYHQPTLLDAPFNATFAHFPWRDDSAALSRWQRGMTGYPLVDAGMRELWHTGYMHNRVRMVAASFLTKHLLVSWRAGQRWFWDTLVDADLANNTLGWQWVAGCGADAAPYFRIFNPTTQAKRFDPDGAYLRRWLPALRHVATDCLFEPWQCNGAFDYPPPVVDHTAARKRALAAYQHVQAHTGTHRHT